MNKKLTLLFAALLFIGGICVLLYPTARTAAFRKAEQETIHQFAQYRAEYVQLFSLLTKAAAITPFNQSCVRLNDSFEEETFSTSFNSEDKENDNMGYGYGDFRPEEPVKQCDDDDQNDEGDEDRIAQAHLPYIALADDERVFGHGDTLVGFEIHDRKIDGIEGKLCQNTGKDRRDAHGSMENTGQETRDHTGKDGAEQSHPDVDAVQHQHNTNSPACCHRAVNSKVCQIQNFISDINTDSHDAPDQTLGNGSRHCVEKCGDVNRSFLL